MATWGQNGTGFDPSEGVQKVAQLVWDTDTLSWVRATQASGAGNAGAVVPSLKKFDPFDAFTLYIGQTVTGGVDSDSVWLIQRITFNAQGFPISITFANGGASTARWDQRTALSYS